MTKKYKKIFQKIILTSIYDSLATTIKDLESARLLEIEYARRRGDIYEQLDKISQKSLSLELKGPANPNWLNTVFKECKDMQTSNLVTLITLLETKYEILLAGKDEKIISNIFELNTNLFRLSNDFNLYSSKDNVDIRTFLDEYLDDDNFLNDFFNNLLKLSENNYLTTEEEETIEELISYLTEGEIR